MLNYLLFLSKVYEYAYFYEYIWKPVYYRPISLTSVASKITSILFYGAVTHTSTIVPCPLLILYLKQWRNKDDNLCTAWSPLQIVLLHAIDGEVVSGSGRSDGRNHHEQRNEKQKWQRETAAKHLDHFCNFVQPHDCTAIGDDYTLAAKYATNSTQKHTRCSSYSRSWQVTSNYIQRLSK